MFKFRFSKRMKMITAGVVAAVFILATIIPVLFGRYLF